MHSGLYAQWSVCTMVCTHNGLYAQWSVCICRVGRNHKNIPAHGLWYKLLAALTRHLKYAIAQHASFTLSGTLLSPLFGTLLSPSREPFFHFSRERFFHPLGKGFPALFQERLVRQETCEANLRLTRVAQHASFSPSGMAFLLRFNKGTSLRSARTIYLRSARSAT